MINYGGRVTDDKDERFIRTFAKRFMNEDMVKKEGADANQGAPPA